MAAGPNVAPEPRRTPRSRVSPPGSQRCRSIALRTLPDAPWSGFSTGRRLGVAGWGRPAQGGNVRTEIPGACRDLLAGQCGVPGRQQALRSGLRGDIIDGLLRIGRLQRLHQGVYAAFTGEPGRDAPSGVWLVRSRAEFSDRRDTAIVAVRMSGHAHHPSGHREPLPRSRTACLHRHLRLLSARRNPRPRAVFRAQAGRGVHRVRGPGSGRRSGPPGFGGGDDFGESAGPARDAQLSWRSTSRACWRSGG